MNKRTKKFLSAGDTVIPKNEQVAFELRKQITRKFGNRKSYSSLGDNIWGADNADMQLITKRNKRV